MSCSMTIYSATIMLSVVALYSILPCVLGYSLSLNRISTLYLPKYDQTTGAPVYKYDDGIMEQIDYDAEARLVYAVGPGELYVVDVSQPNNLTILSHTTNPDELTDVAICGDHVFMSVYNNDLDINRLHGHVHVLKKYDNSSNSLSVLHIIQVGPRPDKIKVTKDCKTVLVAEEGRAFFSMLNKTNFIDPEGSIGVIKFPNGADNNYTYTQLGFSAFNDRFAELEKQGVRVVYRGHVNPFANSVEPEYITYNTDESIAYITLQENNAVAVVDLKSETITAIHGLGYKSWTSYKLDPSDKDGGIHMANYDIRSLYLPDAIHYKQWNGQNILILANEGKFKKDEEVIRGAKIPTENLSDKISATMRMALANDSMLGRLKFSSIDGLDSSGKLEHLYFYGSRSFTIRQASDMTILYDSGDVIETMTSELQPEIFNSGASGKSTAREESDGKSDIKGPECQSIETAELGGRLFIFVGCQRPGTVVVFSVGDDFIETRFEYLYHNIPRFDTDFRDLYEERSLSEISIEGMRYVAAENSPNGRPILFVAGTQSGTLSILEINIDGLIDTTTVSSFNGVWFFSPVLGCMQLTASVLVGLFLVNFHM